MSLSFKTMSRELKRIYNSNKTISKRGIIKCILRDE